MQNNFSEKKNKVKNIISLFDKRVKWGFFKKNIANGKELPKAIGFKNFLEKIDGIDESFFAHQVLDSLCSLEDKLYQHCLFGDKNILISKVDDMFLNDCQSVVLRLNILSNPSQKNHSFLYNNDLTHKPKLINVSEDAHGYNFVFGVLRKLKVKESVSLSIINDESRNDFSNGSKLYSVKQVEIKCFDVIHVSKINSILEIRIDDNLSTFEDINYVRSSLLRAFKDFFERDFYPEWINLFPCVKKLLDLPIGDGSVIELKFMTNEGAIKTHKDNRSCILKESYHTAGSKSILDQYDPYKISRSWVFGESNNEIILSLPGNTRNLHGNRLEEALITGASSKEEYMMAFNKLLSLNGIHITQGIS